MNAWEKLVIGGLSKALTVATKSRGRQTLSILIYHRVLGEKDYLRPDEPVASEFEWQMELVSRFFTPLSLHEALTRMAGGDLPENAVCVTFDDGYSDNQTIALPILKDWNIPVTVFVSTGFLNGGRMWNDSVLESIRSFKGDMIDLTEVGLGRFDMSSQQQRKLAADKLLPSIKYLSLAEREEALAVIQSRVESLPDSLMMTDEQLRDMDRAGVEIGAHTVNHPILSSISDSEARAEIGQGKTQLETILDRQVRFFAYPNGRAGRDYNTEHCKIVKELGFKAAVSTDLGVSTGETDLFNLPRFTPWDKTPVRFNFRMFANSREVK